MTLDAHLQRYQNLEPFNIYSITTGGDITPWYNVDGTTIVRDLVLNEINVAQQVQLIGSQIGHWARLTAQAKRVWEIEERNYRVWRSQTWLDIIRYPQRVENEDGTSGWEDKPGWGRTAKLEPKSPSKEQAEAIYRVNPEYTDWQNRIERAEEAYTSADGILDAFKAKRDMLKVAVWRNRETGEVELSI